MADGPEIARSGYENFNSSPKRILRLGSSNRKFSPACEECSSLAFFGQAHAFTHNFLTAIMLMRVVPATLGKVFNIDLFS